MSAVWPFTIMVDVMWLVIDVLEIMFVLGIFGLIAGLMWFDGPRGLLKAIRNPPVIPVVGAREIATWYRNVLIPCTVLLIIVFLFSTGSIMKQMGTSDWNETDAIVIGSEERSSTSCDAGGNCTTTYWLHIDYSYTIDGVDYNGSRYSFLSDSNDDTDDYPPGKEIIVYVNPDDNTESVMIRGFEGVLIEMLKGLSFLVLIASILTAVLILWKIGFHLQPAENRKKALEAPREGGKGLRGMFASTGFMRELREMKDFAVMVKKSQEDAFEGEERILTMEIDGNLRTLAVRNLNDMIEPISDMEEYAKISLDQDANGGRNICFKFLGDIDGDEYLEIGEYIGPDLVREKKINMDKNPNEAFEFIERALENANEEGKPWWV